MSVKITSRKQAVLRRFEKGFAETAKAYDEKLHEVIQNPRQWEGEFGVTRRRNGETVVGSFRNIYDTHAMDESQVYELITPFRSRFTWGHPAQIVHQGARLANGGVIPPRPFTAVAARELDVKAAFARGFSG